MDHLVGKRFRNVHDGRVGELEGRGTPEAPQSYSINYKDRAELRREPVTPTTLKQNWALVEGPSHDLLDVEIEFISRTADQALRAIEKHEPFQFWKLGQADGVIYDGGLVEVIVGYLRARR